MQAKEKNLNLWKYFPQSWHFSEKIKADYQRELLFIVACLVSIYLTASLISFSTNDPSSYSLQLPQGQIKNLGGLSGAYLAGGLFYFLGISAFFIPIACFYMAFSYLKKTDYSISPARFLGWMLIITGFSSMLTRIFSTIYFEGIEFPICGRLGELSFYFASSSFGKLGHDLLSSAAAYTGLLLVRQKAILLSGIKLPKLFKFKKTFSFPTKSGKNSLDAKKSIPVKSIEVTKPIPIKSVAVTKEETLKPEASELPVKQHYTPPPVGVFKSQTNQQIPSKDRQKEFEKTAARLVEILGDFHVEGEMIGIQPGPVVTVYEFQPKAGTKLTKITGLMDDIALALKVDSIFIHPVSGSPALGIQVPNQKRQIVYLGDILKSSSFQDACSPLSFAMGQSLRGDAICEDLAAMPHLLTAGQTGSGKSVAINSLLCSIILKASPEQVRMILVDPKILELKIYEGIPHLLMPVITEATRASLALKWACYEMDRRYQLMEMVRVRHISGFNQYWRKAAQHEKDQLAERAEQEKLSELPYIVIVIDELADLMLTAPKDVEASIQRLAQKARACGIHLVLATQRPSVDVITGVIKANLPCRIAFKVFSRADSRTILDSIGAEKLLGKGDMLFLKPGSSKLERIQGAFLADEEVVDMMANIQSDATPEYDEDAIAWIEEELSKGNHSLALSIDGDDAGEDPKWDEAISIAQKNGTISASYLQRSLKIGYNRAARIVESMEQQSLVAKADGSKPRKWLGPN